MNNDANRTIETNPEIAVADKPHEDHETWTHHEHVSAPVQAQAQKLLNEAGSPDLAKHAVDVAAQNQLAMTLDKDEFARRYGFQSYLDFFEASAPAQSNDGANWFVTAVLAGRWIVWNSQELPAVKEFASAEEAKQEALERGATA